MKTLMDLGRQDIPFLLENQKLSWFKPEKKYRLQIVAMGDVGGTIALALHLLGQDTISEIGVFDLNENLCKRYEMEINQILDPFEEEGYVPLTIIEEKDLFDCDVFLFCATKAVPPVSPGEKADMRMLQYENNRPLVSYYGKMAAERNYKGLFCLVSDPVDPLCKAAYLAASEVNKDFSPYQIKGYGLGVMNARARYFAKKDADLSSYLTEGRAFGPHGQSLVIANSVDNYDVEKSERLTELTVTSNLVTRDLGFKPYLAPALSSATLSILRTLTGKWHYSSTYLRGVYLGSLNRMTIDGPEWEILDLPDPLFERIEKAYKELEELN